MGERKLTSMPWSSRKGLPGRSARVAMLGCVLGACWGFSACTPPEEPSPSPSATPESTPTPFPTAMCEWTDAPAVTTLNPWWYDAVFYEIFVRSFQDSNGDGIGDLKGLISRLDYLNDGDPSTDADLGVTALWLMPVFQSNSVHGYDVVDYQAVESDYGTEADLLELLTQAHARGIRVILDLPFNHTSVNHPWFQASSSSEDSPYRDYYVWSDTDLGDDWTGRNGAYFYAAFDGSLPDLNYNSQGVLDGMADVYRYWLERGVDGFRLDGAKYLVEDGSETENTPRTHCYLQEMRRYVNRINPDAVLVGEVWDLEDTISTYFGDGLNELSSAFDFKASDGIVNALVDQNAAELTGALNIREFYGPDVRMFAPFLRNHDMDRTGSVFASSAQRYAAMVVELALSGPSFIYYGEEIGMKGLRGDENNDNARRSPMQWNSESGAGFTASGVTPWYPINAEYTTVNVETQKIQADLGQGDLPQGDSLWRKYQKVIQLRLSDADPVLRGPDFALLTTSPSASVVAFLRGTGDGAILLLLNVAQSPISDVTVTFKEGMAWSSGADLLSDVSMAGPLTGTYSVGTLSANEVRLVRLSL